MRKLFTSAIGVLLFAPVFGQKDIEFKLHSPTNGQEMYINETINLIYSFKNVGNDWIDFDDSFFVSLKIDGDYLLGTFNKKLIVHSNIPPGDSVYVLDGFSFTYKEPNPISFCLEFTTSKKGVKVDSNQANNFSCATITVNERTSGIDDINSNLKLLLYPNPATNAVVLKTNNLQASKALLTDINGREVATLQLQNGSADFDISILQNGLYFCQLLDKENKYLSSEKLLVSH